MNHSKNSQLRSLLGTLALSVTLGLVALLFAMTLRGATQANARSIPTSYQQGLAGAARESETEHPTETETAHPEATETEHPQETETELPRETETEHPRETETAHPEGTETEHPLETQTVLPQGTQTSVAVPGTGSRTFPETGKAVSGLFLQYWDKNGGLAQQGFPISGVMQEKSDLDGKTYTVQYFERAVMEYHSEKQAPFNVLLSQLGTFQYRQKYANGAPNQKANQTNGHYFEETRHWVGGVFWKYWQEHGGLAQQGYPLSDEFTEVSPLNGKTYTVQYFERAVFELHPENKAPFDVLLSQLGTFQYKQKYNGK